MGLFRKLFIPHEENDFKPDILQKAAVVGMMLMVLLSFSLANFQSIVWINSEWLVSTVLPAIVTDATNKARSEQNLSSLRRSELLDRVANLKAEDMAKSGYFAHWSPQGVSPWYWFGLVGYDYVYAGENLAVHFTDSERVVEAWLDSPTHRANIMNNNYSEIGIGTAKGEYEGYDTVFVVQMFGTRAAVAPKFVEPVAVLGNTMDTSPLEDVTAAPVPIVAGIGEEVVEPVTSVTAEGTTVYESFASDVNENAETARVEGEVYNSDVPLLSKVATSPKLVLQILYSIIGLFVLGVLMFALIMEWRRHHPIQIAYSAGLLMVMTLLFVLHGLISGGVMIA